MASVDPRIDREQLEALGEAIYAQRIRPALSSHDRGKFVLIDTESGDYEINSEELVAEERLHARRPNAQVWMLRVGSRCARHIGPGSPVVRQ